MCLPRLVREEYLGSGRWSAYGARAFLLSVRCMRGKQVEVLTSAVDSVDNRVLGADAGIFAVQS